MNNSNIIKNIIFTVITVVLFFIIIEGALRILNIGNPAYDYDPGLGYDSETTFFVRNPNFPEQIILNPKFRFHFQDLTFLIKPAPNTYRVFFLGGSNTNAFPTGMFEEQYNADHLISKTLEFINAGACGFGSRRVTKIAEEVSAFHPDMFFVYMGQNEYLDLLISKNVLKAKQNLPFIRSILSKTYLYTALKNTYRKITKPKLEMSREEEQSILSTPMGINEDKDITYRELNKATYDRFHLSLKLIIKNARSAGAKTVLSTVASNSLIPPFMPVMPRHLSEKDVEKIKNLEQEADSLLGDNINFTTQDTHRFIGFNLQPEYFKTYAAIFYNSIERSEQYSDRLAGIEKLSLTSDEKKIWKQALNKYQKALDIEPGLAMIQYKVGVIHYALENFEKAKKHFDLSAIYDAGPLKATPQINEAIKQVAEEENVPLIDFEKHLCNQSYAHICGWDYIQDHVHLNQEASRDLMTDFGQKLKVLEH
jgi:hypothetical protein